MLLFLNDCSQLKCMDAATEIRLTILSGVLLNERNFQGTPAKLTG